MVAQSESDNKAACTPEYMVRDPSYCILCTREGYEVFGNRFAPSTLQVLILCPANLFTTDYGVVGNQTEQKRMPYSLVTYKFVSYKESFWAYNLSTGLSKRWNIKTQIAVENADYVAPPVPSTDCFKGPEEKTC